MHESKPILVTMTAKEFSMAAAKALIKDANSSKTKTGITIPPNINTVVKGDVIGYTPPFTPIDGVVLTYKWKSVAWEGISNNEFKIEVTIAKTGNCY